MITDTTNLINLLKSRSEIKDIHGDVAFAILERAVIDANSVGMIEGVGNGTKNHRTGERYGIKHADAIRMEARIWLTGDECRPVLRALGLRHGWMNNVLADHTTWANRFYLKEAA